MQKEVFVSLSPHIRKFVEHIELVIGFEIIVNFNPELDLGGPFKKGILKTEIHPNSAKIHAPTNGYFPDGAVLHELLHIERFLIKKVPRISLAERVLHNPRLENALVSLDNTIEHLIIVPEEIRTYPERRAHWEAITERVWLHEIPQIQDTQDKHIFASLNWAFLHMVLPGSPTTELARNWLNRENIYVLVESFYSQLTSTIHDKKIVVAMFFSFFSNLPRDSASLEYLRKTEGSKFEIIPDFF